MKSFLQFTESMTLDSNNQVVIDYETKTGDLINLRFGKCELKPYTKNIEGVELDAFSLYTSKGSDATIILKQLKVMHINEIVYNQFLNRSAVYAARIIRDLKIDIIVTPKSSSSLTKDFAQKIKERNPGIEYLLDSFVKSEDPSKITLDLESKKLSDNTIKKLESSIRRGVKLGYFQMKWILPPYRKFLKNVFSYTGNAKKFEDKTVLIIDDVIASGSSLVSIFQTLQEAGAESVKCLTIFKAHS